MKAVTSDNRVMTFTHGTSRPFAYVGWLFLLLAAGAFMRFFLLTNQSLWYDEGVSLVLTDSGNPMDTIGAMWSRTGGDKYQPLYYVVLSLWRAIAGDSEFALRLVSVVPGILGLLYVYKTVVQVSNSRHAFWSTLFLAFSAFWVCYSQEVRPYSLLFLLAAMQLYWFVPALNDMHAESVKPASGSFAFAVITAVSCFGSILLVVFSVALALAHLVVGRQPMRWLRWWFPAVVACMPAALYFAMTPVLSGLSPDSTNGIGMPLYKNAVFSLYGLLLGHTYGPPLDLLRDTSNVRDLLSSYGFQLGIAGLVIAMYAVVQIALIVRMLRRSDYVATLTAFLVALFMFSLALAFAVAHFSGINWMPRHSFYIGLPIAILLPLSFCASMPVPLRRRLTVPVITPGYLLPRFAMGCFVALIGMNVFASMNYFYKAEYWRDDYRSAAAFLRAHQSEDGNSILLWGETRLLSYYGDVNTRDAWKDEPAPLRHKMANVDQGDGKVFVAINREFAWSRDQDSAVATQVADDYDLVSVQKYVNFNIYEFQNKHVVSTN